jgi:DNA-binding transcriptional MerR regulator
MSIGQVAERTGLSVHALRFYENEGIFANPCDADLAGAAPTARMMSSG